MTVRFNLTVFALTLLMGLSLRTVMLISVVDPVSGFIKAEYSFYAVIIIAFIIFAAGFIFLTSYFMPLKASEDYLPSSIPFNLSLLVMAAAVFYESFVMKIGFAANAIQQLLYYVFSAITVVALIYMCVFKFIKKPYHPIASLFLAVFFIVRMIIIFADFSSISTTSDTIIETVLGCLIIVVSMYYAKLEGGAANKKRTRLFFALSL